MKIALYGVSTVGKDTFIESFLKDHIDYKHIKGSKALDEKANEKYGISFHLLQNNEKEEIRKEFCKDLKSNNENIIIDGHYLFPESSVSYNIVFTDEDRDLYDVFFYLKGKPSVIKERIKKSPKNSNLTFLSEEDIEGWQKSEINDMRDICFKYHKEFIVLDDNFDESLSFIKKYLENPFYYNSYETAKRYVKEIKNYKKNEGKIALIDCDRTVSKEDTSISYFNINNVDTSSLKEIFKGDIYTVYQFYRQQQLYKDATLLPDINEYSYNSIVDKKLKSLKQRGYLVAGVTSGIVKIWEAINEKKDLFNLVIGNNDNNLGIITGFVKGYIAEILKNEGFYVVSIGDSMIDILMLETSNEGFIYAPGKIREEVQNYIINHK